MWKVLLPTKNYKKNIKINHNENENCARNASRSKKNIKIKKTSISCDGKNYIIIHKNEKENGNKVNLVI